MKEKLILKAQELRQHGFTTGEIADELNVSMDTARWLTLQNLSYGEAEVVCGIAVSGIPFATLMADLLEDMTGVDTSLAIFHPHKHRKDTDDTDDEGTISTNFGSVEGKKVVIVDDVITSGKTAREVIHTVKDLGGEPLCVVVLIDKAGLSEIEEVPVESLIRVGRI